MRNEMKGAGEPKNVALLLKSKILKTATKNSKRSEMILMEMGKIVNAGRKASYTGIRM